MDNTARSLADGDALRLLMTFSRDLPVAGQTARRNDEDRSDQMLHARVQGKKLGSFDANFDSTALEPVWAGQLKTINGVNYYDLWTSFVVPRPQAGNKVDSPRDSSSGIPDVVTSPITKSRPGSLRRRGLNLRPSRALRCNAVVTAHCCSNYRVLFLDHGVQADGQPVEFIHNPAIEGTQLARRGNDFVAVVFPGPLRKGQTFDLRFTYAGDDVLAKQAPDCSMSVREEPGIPIVGW